MAVNCVRSSWDLIRSTASIVSVVYFVYGLMVTILKNSHLALVVIEAAEAMFVGIFLRVGARNGVGQVLGNSIEMLLLQCTVAASAMTAAAGCLI